MIKLNLSQTFQYLIEAVIEVFSPDTDNYPAIGIQPFKGEISNKEYFNK